MIAPVVTAEIGAEIAAIENDAALYEEAAFARRVDAIDRLELHVIDRIDSLLDGPHPPDELTALRDSAERVMRRLEDADDRLFRRLREEIRAGRWRGAELERVVRAYAAPAPGARREGVGYDALDEFINGLLLTRPLPEETMALEPEMVAYHKTPARIILELVARARLAEGDVFCDVGSGLGQVPILVHLLTGASARGIELEPAYCDLARACVADLDLSRVEFIHADARTADYSAGDVFFMYTPFRGEMLGEVLGRLEAQSRGRPIRLFTYGPCTPEVARQVWLAGIGPCDDVNRLAEFVRP